MEIKKTNGVAQAQKEWAVATEVIKSINAQQKMFSDTMSYFTKGLPNGFGDDVIKLVNGRQ